MAAPSAQGNSLKERNAWAVRAFILLHALAFVAVLYADAALLAYKGLNGSFESTELGELARLIGPVLSMLAVGSFMLLVVQSLLSGISANFGEVRDALIHWRWPSPLPGRRAFTAIGSSSSRVDMDEIERRFGQLPTDPCQQNELFTKVYRSVKDETGVLDSHRQYLLMREIAVVTLFCALSLPWIVAALNNDPVQAWTYAGVLLLQFFAFALAAQGHNRRLVENVLVEASSQTNASGPDPSILSPTPTPNVG
ncbi:MAG: hypothetical protein AAGF48_13610 [Pseudomonadota bacterium]